MLAYGQPLSLPGELLASGSSPDLKLTARVAQDLQDTFANISQKQHRTRNRAKVFVPQ